MNLISENLSQMQWDSDYRALVMNRRLAQDIGMLLSGRQFEPLSNFISPNPRQMRERSVEDIERTLLQWAKEG